MKTEMIAAVVVTLTVVCVFQLNRIERRWVQTLLNWFPAILFAYVLPAAFTHISGMDLSGVYLHQLSRNWIIPFTILTVMSALSFAQLRIIGARPIVVFVIGSFVIAALPVVLVILFGWFDASTSTLFLEQEYWKGLVPIVGGWIGGSTSQLVLKEVIGTEEGLFLSILVLDNILVNIWTILMFQFIKRSEQLNHVFGIHDEVPVLKPDSDSQKAVLAPWQITFVLLAITALVTLTIKSFLWMVITTSIVGLLLGNLVKSWNASFVLKIGGILIIVIMAILGLKLNFNNLSLPGPLVALVVIWLIGHFVFMLLAAAAFRLNIAWVPIGSMANLGGISTAPAVTSAYNKELMPHAILLAILSMVTGTAWGLFTIYLFETLI